MTDPRNDFTEYAPPLPPPGFLQHITQNDYVEPEMSIADVLSETAGFGRRYPQPPPSPRYFLQFPTPASTRDSAAVRVMKLAADAVFALHGGGQMTPRLADFLDGCRHAGSPAAHVRYVLARAKDPHHPLPLLDGYHNPNTAARKRRSRRRRHRR